MHAVVRETSYDSSKPIQERTEFKEFQALHASQKGYRGTLVADAGDGVFLTMTLWETRADADEARRVLSPVIGRLLNPLMTGPAKLLGTGPIVVNDLL
jgi:hypothetical protein